MLTHYILRGKEPVEVTRAEWLTWKETADRQIARTDIRPGLWVRTMFSGLQRKGDPPSTFETAICGPERERVVCTYATYAEAVLGHHQIVKDTQFAVQRKQ
jgi:hypothetical protein